MAITALAEPPQIHRLRQSKYIDSVRWLPPLSALDRLAVIAVFDSDSDSAAIETHSFAPDPENLTQQSQWFSPSRISSLKTSQSHHKPLVAAATLAGSIHILFGDSMDPASLESELSMPEKALHEGPISCVDIMDGGVECVSVGEDGRVNLVSVGESELSYQRIFDSSGLVSFTTAKWASPSEFATGGYGFSLQWWDQRKPGAAVSQLKGNWSQRTTPGIVHSIDIHPSRKHTCLAGGSLGTVFAWDLRWPQQPILLSGVGAGETTHSPCESEVWEVHFDHYTKSSNAGNVSSRILPTMICSEDGILAVVEQGEEPIELLAEPCAINSFDIDRQYPSHDADAVICHSELSSKLKSATYIGLKRMTGATIQDEVPVLMSGAGHDAMDLSHLTKVGMLFVRCRGGISHFPEDMYRTIMFGHLKIHSQFCCFPVSISNT